jgi:hypothetical protein
MSDTKFESTTQVEEVKEEKADDGVTATISEVFLPSLVHTQFFKSRLCTDVH